MSAYSTNETQFKDLSLLLAALTEMGFDSSKVEIHDKATNLIGYHGDKRADLANVIIRRRYIGSASNDIGFVKLPNGTYGAIISDYDSHRFNGQWVGKLTAAYARNGLVQQMRKQGFKHVNTVGKNGKSELQFIRG